MLELFRDYDFTTNDPNEFVQLALYSKIPLDPLSRNSRDSNSRFEEGDSIFATEGERMPDQVVAKKRKATTNRSRETRQRKSIFSPRMREEIHNGEEEAEGKKEHEGREVDERWEEEETANEQASDREKERAREEEEEEEEEIEEESNNHTPYQKERKEKRRDLRFGKSRRLLEDDSNESW